MVDYVKVTPDNAKDILELIKKVILVIYNHTFGFRLTHDFKRNPGLNQFWKTPE